MKSNKNGFTLVELLAVIVVLAVVMLIASSSVGSTMIKARKAALAIEGEELVNAARQAYQLGIMEGDIQSGSACFSLQYLYNEGYFSKGDTDSYTGSVLVKPDATGKKITYKFWISNGSYDFICGNAGCDPGVKSTEAGTNATASAACGTQNADKKFS